MNVTGEGARDRVGNSAVEWVLLNPALHTLLVMGLVSLTIHSAGVGVGNIAHLIGATIGLAAGHLNLLRVRG